MISLIRVSKYFSCAWNTWREHGHWLLLHGSPRASSCCPAAHLTNLKSDAMMAGPLGSLLCCRWQRLNRSLETVTTVHDGGRDGTEGPAGADNCCGGGIAVHAVKEVGAQLGWACTQLAPEQAPVASEPPRVACEALATASSSGEEGLAAETAMGAGLQSEPRPAAETQPPPFGAAESTAAADSQACKTLSAGHSDLAHHQDSQQSRCTPVGAQPQPPVNASREKQLELSQPGKPSHASQSQSNLNGALPDSAPQADAAQLPACAGTADQATADPGPPPLVYFEVGQHTNRVHFHGKEDGSELLGLSLPLDMLSAPEDGCGSSTIQDLLSHLESRHAHSPTPPSPNVCQTRTWAGTIITGK